jgi:hypothetical protein
MISVWIVSSFAFYAVSNAGYSGTSSAVIAPLAVQGHIRLSYMPQSRVADNACKGSTFELEKSFPALFNSFLTIQHALALYFPSGHRPNRQHLPDILDFPQVCHS